MTITKIIIAAIITVGATTSFAATKCTQKITLSSIGANTNPPASKPVGTFQVADAASKPGKH